MKTAAHLLKSKAHPSVHAVAPEVSVFDAMRLMTDKNIGALLVSKIILMSRSSKQAPVREIMTSAVMYVRPVGCRVGRYERQVSGATIETSRARSRSKGDIRHLNLGA